MIHLLRLSVIASAALYLSGCEETPLPPPVDPGAETTALPGGTVPSHVPTPNQDRSTQVPGNPTNADTVASTPPSDPSQTSFAGLVGPIPVTWQWEPVRHHFRVAQWTVPGRNGGEPAELVVTTFPEASGNTIQNNIDRWTRQFRSTDGAPSTPDIETKNVNGLSITVVDLEGEYLGMGGGWHKADYRMLVSIVEAPSGSVFIKLLGPIPTVSANADGYMNLLDHLRESNSSTSF